MEKIIPAVSSSVAGPAGISHLPRLWLTAIADAKGMLASGYTPGFSFDRMLTDNLGIDAGAFAAFLATFPTYQIAEAWVLANARAADAGTIGAHNARIVGSAAVRDHDLADWARIHAFLLERAGSVVAPIVPLVSMHTTGPAGIKHLPRMWVKARLFAAGALPDSWRSGETRVVYADGVLGTLPTPGQGIDAITAANLGIDIAAMTAFVSDTSPDYPAFEAWVLANATKLDASALEFHHSGAGKAAGEKVTLELARMGYSQYADYEMYTYNDLGDWDAVHAQLVELSAGG